MLCNSFFKALVQDRSGLCFQKLSTASFCCLTAGTCSICSVTLWAVLMWGKKDTATFGFLCS